VVGPNGRVTECRVIRSSGNAELDETTCRLILERFRFAPARDAQGRKVSDVVVEDHTWVIDD
jgi:protein TonB